MPRRKVHGIPPTKRVKQPEPPADLIQFNNKITTNNDLSMCGKETVGNVGAHPQKLCASSPIHFSTTESPNPNKYLHKKFKKMATTILLPEDAQLPSCVVNGTKLKGSIGAEENEKPPPSPAKSQQDGRSSPSVGRYVCPYCKLACAKPSVLQKHVRAHTNERPYPCLLCGFAFKTKSNLYKHCRSRAHALKMDESGVDQSHVKFNFDGEMDSTSEEDDSQLHNWKDSDDGSIKGVDREELTLKPIYKPKFHKAAIYLDSPLLQKTEQSKPPSLQLKIPPAPVSQQMTTPSPFTSGSSPSPEFLHRHISKLISENQAIVETQDPFWPKKFLQRTNKDSNSPSSPSSSSPSPGADSSLWPKKFFHRQTSLSASETLNVPEDLVGRQNTQSKLALALLRPQTPTSPQKLQCSPPKVYSNSLDTQPLNLSTNNTKTDHIANSRKRRYSEGIPPHNVRDLSSLPSSLQCFKTSEVQSFRNNQEFGKGKLSPFDFSHLVNHIDEKTENSKGSIIKELLLKARAASTAGVPMCGMYGTAVASPMDVVLSEISDERSFSPSSPYVCRICKMSYRTMETLEMHQMYYCKGPTDEQLIQPPIIPVSLKTKPNCESRNVMTGIALPQPSPGPLLGNTPLVDCYASSELNLQKHLPPANRKRKVAQHATTSPADIRALSATTLRSLEELSRCPMRLNSLQMFGGEVQIMDSPGGEAKTLRIEPLNRTSSTPSEIPISIPNRAISSKAIDQSDIKNMDSTPQIVTIAKTGLHSGGGTMLQVPQRLSETQLSKPRNNVSPSALPTTSSHLLSNSNYPETNKLIIPLVPSVVTPDLSIPGIPSPFPSYSTVRTTDINPLTNITAYNPLTLPPSSFLHPPPKTAGGAVTPSIIPYAGGIVTILHGGKAIPYVPGMPGPHTILPNPILPVEPKLVNDMPCTRSPDLPKIKQPNTSSSCQTLSESMPELDKIQTENETQTKPLSPTVRLEYISSVEPCTKRLLHGCDETPKPSTAKRKDIILLLPDLPESSPEISEAAVEKRFLRPTSLPLKPGTYTPKRQLVTPGSQVLSLVSPETPRPRKSYGQLYLNGHAYTYLGLKCSTRMFFCTLNKPQPIYVPLSPEHNKVSMYSNWKVRSESDPNPLGLDPGKAMAYYDSRHRPTTYTLAHTGCSEAVTHSSYWLKQKEPTVTAEDGHAVSSREDDSEKSESGGDVLLPKRVKIFAGGFESNEDYIYVRGRGRGRYVCEECGIRCKKPSMLKKHIRTHTDVRPFTCAHCSFSFKTKGNLTKHMKSKAHYKKCVELGITPVPTVVDDSCIDEEILARQQALRAGRELESESEEEDEDEDEDEDDDDEEDEEEWKCRLERDAASSLLSLSEVTLQSAAHKRYAGAGLVALCPRPNTYPYLIAAISTAASVHSDAHDKMSQKSSAGAGEDMDQEEDGGEGGSSDLSPSEYTDSGGSSDVPEVAQRPIDLSSKTATTSGAVRTTAAAILGAANEPALLLATICSTMERLPVNTRAGDTQDSHLLQVYLTERAVRDSRMKQQYQGQGGDGGGQKPAITENGSRRAAQFECFKKISSLLTSAAAVQVMEDEALMPHAEETKTAEVEPNSGQIANCVSAEKRVSAEEGCTEIEGGSANPEAKESALGILAQTCSDAASANAASLVPGSPTMQIRSKLKAEFILPCAAPSPSYVSVLEDGRSMCVICNKVFTKPSQLRLHINIHYFERPFRCESCAVSFRTKGHLQKHQRSVSHLNKVNMNSTFGTATSSNPRPFKCDDCKIAFRIHGHLAKHLRSKMHIMKLECLGKLPFGTYAEMERSGVNMNDIDTTDCDNSLESLQLLAQKLYEKDPSKLGQWDPNEMMPQPHSHSCGDTSSDDEDALMVSHSPHPTLAASSPTKSTKNTVIILPDSETPKYSHADGVIHRNSTCDSLPSIVLRATEQNSVSKSPGTENAKGIRIKDKEVGNRIKAEIKMEADESKITNKLNRNETCR